MTKQEYDPITDKLLWLDLETTGLQPEKTFILEIGAKIVTSKLEVLDQFKRVVQYDETRPMDIWCHTTHSNSGLLAEIAIDGVPLKFAELAMVAWLDKWFPENKIKQLEEGSKEGRIILCGTGIGFDRRYIRFHMPLLNEKLHHRMVDITAVYYFNKIFRPEAKLPEKTTREQLQHRSLTDIEDSINMARGLI